LREAVEHALKLLNFNFQKKIRKLVIKPNLCYYWKSSTGETTDPKLVEAIIDVFRDHLDLESVSLVESDATAMSVRHAFRMLGFERLAKEKNINLVNLCEDSILSPEIHTALPFHLSVIPKTLAEKDFFISVPKLKLHPLTGLSCALKNQFGCIPIQRKVVFHKDISKVIASINKIITPDLILVDGIICKGKTPKLLNLILAGCDPVAVDYVAAKIAGLSPRKIGHIVESENLGVGSTNVEHFGDDWIWFKNIFPRNPKLYSLSMRYLVKLYGIYLRRFTLEGRIFGVSSPEAGW